MVRTWWSSVNHREKRHFVRTLVPHSLWNLLKCPGPGIFRPAHMSLLNGALVKRRKSLNNAVYAALSWLQQHPLPFDPIKMAHPLSTTNLFKQSHGILSTSSPPPPHPCGITNPSMTSQHRSN